MADSTQRVLELGNSTRGFADQREPFTDDGDLGRADVVVMHFAELGNLFAQLVGQDKEAAWPRVQAGMKRLEAYLESGGTLIAVPVATSSAYYGAQPYVKELIGWAQKTIGAEPKHKTGQQVVAGDDPAYRAFYEKIGAALYHTMFLDNPEGPVGLMVPEGHECVATHRWVGDGGLVLALPEVKNPEKRREYVDAAVALAQALRDEAGHPARAATSAPAEPASADNDDDDGDGDDLSARSDRAGAAIGPLERLLSSVRAASRSSQTPDNDDEDEDEDDDELGAAPATEDAGDIADDIAADDEDDDESEEIAADEAAVEEVVAPPSPPPAAAPTTPTNPPTTTTAPPQRPAAPPVQRQAATPPANDDRVPAMTTVERSAAVPPRREWADHFLLPADAAIAQQVMAIEEKIAELQAEQKRLRQQLVSGNHRKALFVGTGDGFAAAAREAFADLGYKVERAGNGETSFVLTHAAQPDRHAVAYCAGTAGALGGREVIARLLHLEASYFATHGELPKILAVLNPNASQPLDQRDEAPFDGALVKLAGQRGWCVVSGLQLMGMTLDGEESPEKRENLASQLHDATGTLDSYADWQDFLVKT